MKNTSTRIFSAGFAALLVASCGPESVPPQGQEVECAIGEGADFAAVCTLERSADSEVVSFLIHHPDGGFRRVEYDAAKDEIGVGDGADPLKVSRDSTDDIAEFAIGFDRYKVPSAALRSLQTGTPPEQ